MVSVVVITYKHESYIKQTLESILAQEVDFDIEIIIADDNSPDDTEKIALDIRDTHKNGHWIKYTKHNVNKGMMSNFIWALQQCKGKYVALCEGDDYWIDSLKLKKQVHFLQNNEEFGFIHTDTKVYYQDTGDYVESLNKEKGCNLVNRHNPAEDLILGNYAIYTLTVLFRQNLLKNINFEEFGNYKMGDLPLWLTFTKFTKFHCLDEATAVYRKTVGSASNPKNKSAKLAFKISSKSVRLQFSKYLNLKPSTINLISDQYYKAVLRKKYEDNVSQLSYKTFHSIQKKSFKDVVLFLGSKSKILNKLIKKVLPKMS